MVNKNFGRMRNLNQSAQCRPQPRESPRSAKPRPSSAPTKFTKKGREYAEKLDDAPKEVFRAVNADRAYRGYHLRAFKAKTEYRDALEEERETLADAYVERKWAERVAKGVTAMHVRQRLGIELEMVNDDGHPAWEDLADEEIDALEQEEMWRADEKLSQLEIAPPPDKEAREALRKKAKENYRLVVWKNWSVAWWFVVMRMTEKMEQGLGPKDFTKKERLMFRWYKLPGDAKDWPEDADFWAWEVDPVNTPAAKLVLAEIQGDEPSDRFEEISSALRRCVG
ncbi:MAG: hypothetical protein M1823_006164 [Watsoniomyces obsoletus]|nr:MAG: hypothetical protein M1823_006164 [Watsoniomyces obsoletus]